MENIDLTNLDQPVEIIDTAAALDWFALAISFCFSILWWLKLMSFSLSYNGHLVLHLVQINIFLRGFQKENNTNYTLVIMETKWIMTNRLKENRSDRSICKYRLIKTWNCLFFFFYFCILLNLFLCLKYLLASFQVDFRSKQNSIASSASANKGRNAGRVLLWVVLISGWSRVQFKILSFPSFLFFLYKQFYFWHLFLQ